MPHDWRSYANDQKANMSVRLMGIRLCALSHVPSIDRHIGHDRFLVHERVKSEWLAEEGV